MSQSPPRPAVCPRRRLTAMLAGMLAAGAIGALAPRHAGAQAVAGIGDDAIPLPRGVTRVSVGGLWNDYSARYVRDGSGGPLRRRPLLASLATDQAGVALFPQLADAQAALRSLTGNAALALTLGPLEARGDVRQSIAPIIVERGITRRVGVRLVVPYAESRDNAQLLLNRAGSGANVGTNPAFGSSGAAARARNGALLQAVDAARASLAAAIARCQGASATGCEAIRANPQGAQAAVARALAVSTALRTVYGTATQGGAPVVPMQGSPLETAVTGAIAALRTDLAAFGAPLAASDGTPVSATTVLGPGGIPAIAADSSWRLPYQRFGNTRRAGIGDIDLLATMVLVDTDRGDVRRRLLGSQRAVRTLVGVGWRFGVAGADRTEDALDVPIGEGANALLLRSSTDLVLNRSAWVSASVRAALPMTDRVAAVLPPRDVGALFAPFRVGTATRSLGARLEAEVMPRMAVGEYFGVSAGYLLRHWGADRYRALPDSVTDATVATAWRAEGRCLHSAAAGITFSTLAPRLRGASRLAVEVSYLHLQPLGAGGGTPVPAVASDRLELRVYTGFPRR